MKVPFGSIIFYKNIPEFLSSVQRWWTNTIYSHTALYIGEHDVAGISRPLEFDADLRVRLHSFDGPSPHKDIVAFSHLVPERVLSEVMYQVIENYEDEIYGFISWLTIAIRYLFKKLGFKNTHRWRILWGWGTICSELVFIYVSLVVYRMAGVEEFDKLWKDISQYNPNTFTPQDLRELIDKHSYCFKWVYKG